jgi:DNA repair protein RecN (Recombination protein N)
MLRRLLIRDFAIVREVELELGPGFTVLTGETGAGKSILVDALQCVLGSRAEAGLVREGGVRAEVTAEFDAPPALRPWLHEAGFEGEGSENSLLLRRVVDAHGKSRAWVNGSPATVAQLREAAEALVDIHGQHAWQSLTRPRAVRALLDAQCRTARGPGEGAGHELVAAVAAAHANWRERVQRLASARAQRDTLDAERERLAWQVAEVERLAPRNDEWDELNAEHQRLSHAQALLEAARTAVELLSERDGAADVLLSRAIAALEGVRRFDGELAGALEVLNSLQSQLQDATHTLHSYLSHREPDPERLAQLDQRLSAWLTLARRHKRSPPELPGLLLQWQQRVQELEASSDLQALDAAVAEARAAWQTRAEALRRARREAAPRLAQAVTQTMQNLGMAGGRFEVALRDEAEPTAWGLETVELLVSGHDGSTPRALAKVASGGELSRLALAIAVCTSPSASSPTDTDVLPSLIFDEIDAGVGGSVADSVGRLMKQLGASHPQAQVLAVTHLAQVAACADCHFVVSKAAQEGATESRLAEVTGEARVAEVARMLGGERLVGTSRAHAAALLAAPRTKPA